MTKSLTLLGDGSSVDTPARLDTIFVTGAYARSWARRARTSDRSGHAVWRRLRLGMGRPNVPRRRIGVMDRDDFRVLPTQKHRAKPEGELL